MIRRTLLLLVTTALTLIAAGGIALAATLTCTTNPCDGTTDDDMITGTVGAETINGKAGNDEISARDANDTLNGEDGNDTMHGELGDDWLNGGDGPDQLLGEDGADRINGGAGNDDLAGGLGNDLYFVTTSWGSDTILDGGGNNDVIAPAPDGGATAAALPNLTVNLVSSSGPEYTDGNGNTVNWNDNAIGSVSTGAGDDVISQQPKVSNGINGGAGSDTYTGYTSDPFGSDTINDPSGTADVLDFSNFNLADVQGWRAVRDYGSSSNNIVYLKIEFATGGTWIYRYFDNTSTDVCASKPGPGLIETIKFADDPSVDFAQVRSLLGCPPLETTISSMSMEPWEASTKTIFRFSSNDGEATFECKLDNGTFGVCASPKEYPGLIEGSTHTFEVRAVDRAGNTDSTPARRTWTVDTTPPMVSGTNPVNNATGIATTTVVDAFFSEGMDRSTVTTSTVTLTKQGSSTPVSARVEYLSNPKALLTPSSVLEANTTYTATVKGGPGGAKDLTGNALDQDPSTPGGQDIVWSFTTAAPLPTSCTKTGTSGNDVLNGTSGDDVICAGGGNDTINGLGGNDTLRGEAGNDTLLGGVGNDTLDGSLGTDTASYSDSLTAVIASLATNSSTGEGSDAFTGVENLIGSSKADTLTGSTTSNSLTGGGGSDTEQGGSGNDTVIGSGGADTLKGEEGDDTVNSKDGVNGNDSLDGGAGTDTKVTDATEKSIVGFP